MVDQIVTRDEIARRARAAFTAGKPVSECPFNPGTMAAKTWAGTYLVLAREQKKQKVAA